MANRYLPSVLFFAIIFGFVFQQNSSWAGRVIKVKGKKIYIKLSRKEARKASKGDKVRILSKSKKKLGTAVIRKVKGRKAIARLKKGRAEKNNIAKLKRRRKKKRRRKDTIDLDDVASVEADENSSDFVMGFMGGWSMAEQSVDSTTPVDMKGSTLGAKLLLDYPLTQSIGLRTRLGMDIFETSGTDENDNTSETSINYLVLDILARAHFIQNNHFGAFVTLGLGIYSPLSSEVSGDPPALDQNSISATTLFIAGLGVEYKMENGWRIFLGGDYFYFPPSDTVKTTLFGGKIGFLFPL